MHQLRATPPASGKATSKASSVLVLVVYEISILNAILLYTLILEVLLYLTLAYSLRDVY